MLLLLILITVVTKAQSRADNTTSAADISADQSINASVRDALKTALSNPEPLIKQIQLNNSLSYKQKQQQVGALLAKRRRTLDSLLTPEQKKIFLQQAAKARLTSYSQPKTDTSRVGH